MIYLFPDSYSGGGLIIDISIFHAAALFFGIMTLYNLYSANRHKHSYLPAAVGFVMFVSSSLFLISELYGSIAFTLTMVFILLNYRKITKINRNRMQRYLEDSRNAGPLKFSDYFTGWKLVHHLNKKYGAGKASLIYSAFFWMMGLLFIAMYAYL